MTIAAEGASFRAAYARVVGRPPDVRGPDWCPACCRPAALSVFVHPDHNRVGVECAHGCLPFEITEALGLAPGSLDAPEEDEDDPPHAPAVRRVSANPIAGPFGWLRRAQAPRWTVAP